VDLERFSILAWPLQIQVNTFNSIHVKTQKFKLIQGGIMFIRTLKIALCLMLMSVGIAHADLNAYIRDLNISAQGDIGGYKAKLEARFGTSNAQIEVVFRSVESPGDAAIVLWLGEQARQPLDAVLNVYRSQKSQGWGVMAKSLGIKPGTPAFHALKKGSIQLSLDGSGGASNTNAKSKGKNKKSKKNKHS
jgi:hypothetical protein